MHFIQATMAMVYPNPKSILTLANQWRPTPTFIAQHPTYVQEVGSSMFDQPEPTVAIWLMLTLSDKCLEQTLCLYHFSSQMTASHGGCWPLYGPTLRCPYSCLVPLTVRPPHPKISPPPPSFYKWKETKAREGAVTTPDHRESSDY